MAVLRQNGEQLGYIPGEICPRMCEQIEQEYRLAAWVVAITGGQPDKPTLGVNLLILVGDPGVSDESFVAYFNRRISTDQAFLAETALTPVFMDPKNLYSHQVRGDSTRAGTGTTGTTGTVAAAVGPGAAWVLPCRVSCWPIGSPLPTMVVLTLSPGRCGRLPKDRCEGLRCRRNARPREWPVVMAQQRAVA